MKILGIGNKRFIRKVADEIIKVFSVIKKEPQRKKLKNFISEELHKFFILTTGVCSGWVFWRPRKIGIEPTNRCNLNCIMCARKYWDREKNPPGDVPLELFKTKILPFLTRGQYINLQTFGEPLLGEYFFEILYECKKKGCWVGFTTNGTLLKTYAQKIVQLETDSIVVSIDGIKTFEDIRGVELKSIIEGIQQLNSIKRELKVNLPTIGIEFVAMKRNINELSEVIDLAHQLEIHTINVTHVVIHSKQLIDESLFVGDTNIARKYFDESYHRAKKLGIQLNLPPLTETVNFCSQPFEVMFINWNGDVRPCCIATINEENTLILGNLNESSLDELWNSIQMRKIRKALLTGVGLPEFCKKCSMRVNSLESHIRIFKKSCPKDSFGEK